MHGDAFKTKRDPSTADGTARHAPETASKNKSVPPCAQDDGRRQNISDGNVKRGTKPEARCVFKAALGMTG